MVRRIKLRFWKRIKCAIFFNWNFLKIHEQKVQFVVILCLFTIVNGSKILFLVPFNGPSHWIILQNFVKALVNRGHEVTAIVNNPITNFQSTNYTEILIDPPLDLTKFGMRIANLGINWTEKDKNFSSLVHYSQNDGSV